jgi:hypothetical protein
MTSGAEPTNRPLMLHLIGIAPGKPLLNSNVALFPSELREPFPNTATRACATGSFLANAFRHPSRRIRSDCCARAAYGHTATLASPLMDSRRLQSSRFKIGAVTNR